MSDPITPAVRAAATELMTLLTTMLDEAAPRPARVKAAKAILEHCLHSPPASDGSLEATLTKLAREIIDGQTKH
jgi:hypothetical protein